MTHADFITTAMARLVVSGSTPRDNAQRTMLLAQALWDERERRVWGHGLFGASHDREFIDMAAITQSAGVISFISPQTECAEEARKRYEIAIQRWVELREWRAQSV